MNENLEEEKLETFVISLQYISHEYATDSTSTYELVKEVYKDLKTKFDEAFDILKSNPSVMDSYLDKDGINLNEDETVIKEALFLVDVNKIKIKNLLRMCLVHLVSFIEGFNKEFFGELLSFKENIEYEKAVEALDKKYRYLSVFNNNYLKKVYKINLENEIPGWKDFLEMYERRCVYVHHGGRASKKYVQKTTKSDDLLGLQLAIDLKYLKRCFKIIHFYFSYIEDCVFRKERLPKTLSSYADEFFEDWEEENRLRDEMRNNLKRKQTKITRFFS